MKTKTWIAAAMGLAVLWGATAGLSRWIRSQRMTADKVIVYADGKDLSELTGTERSKYLDELADRLNRLEFEERQKLRVQRRMDTTFRQMTEEERLHFLDQTLPQGFQQLMESLNKMNPDQRKRLVQKGLNDIAEAQKRFGTPEAGAPRPPVDDATAKKFVQQGFQSYLESASAETKQDLAPLLEQIQINLQGLRGQ